MLDGVMSELNTSRGSVELGHNTNKRAINEEILDVSVVVPVYNKENIIEYFLQNLIQILNLTNLKYELIIVDDGSIDSTLMKIKSFVSNRRIKVISNKRNMGKGYALKTGFTYSRGKYVIFLDAGLDIDVMQIMRYIDALKCADIVIGSKRHSMSKVIMPFIRRFLSYGFNLLVRLFTGMRVKDTQTGLKALRKNAVEKFISKLVVNRYAFDVELLVVANKYGLKILEFPVNVHICGLFDPREILRMLIDLMRITYRLRVLKYYQLSGSGENCQHTKKV